MVDNIDPTVKPLKKGVQFFEEEVSMRVSGTDNYSLRYLACAL